MSAPQAPRASHTEGPWRWEINRQCKVLHLVGGRPQFDLTIMDFDRWGMGRAVATLRDTAHDGMNIMHRLCDRPDWIAPFPGREHHANWCAGVTHPDMRLIQAAPRLLAALESFLRAPSVGSNGPGSSTIVVQDFNLREARTAIAEAKGAPA
jgi:hypothetical protein